MPTRTRSIYALDPQTKKVRLVVQVTPKGWGDGYELEETLGGLIPVLNHAGISVAVLVSPDATFVIRRAEKSSQFEVDEMDTVEALSPLPWSGDPIALFSTVETWVERVATDWQQFVPETSLPKRVPEIVPLIVRSERRVRDGAIGIPDMVPIETADGS